MPALRAGVTSCSFFVWVGFGVRLTLSRLHHVEVRTLAAHKVVYVNIQYKIESMGGEYDIGKEQLEDDLAALTEEVAKARLLRVITITIVCDEEF